MTEPTEADKIAVLAEWTEVKFDKSWNPFVNPVHWDHLANRLRVRSEPWQHAWADKLLDVIFEQHHDSWEAYRATARSVLEIGGWINYRVATATPAEKAEALYRAIVEQKGPE